MPSVVRHMRLLSLRIEPVWPSPGRYHFWWRPPLSYQVSMTAPGYFDSPRTSSTWFVQNELTVVADALAEATGTTTPASEAAAPTPASAARRRPRASVRRSPVKGMTGPSCGGVRGWAGAVRAVGEG